MATDVCEKCGQTLTIGEWPFCPHGVPDNFGIQTDESWIGGKTFENLSPRPLTFYSRAEHRAYLKAHGIIERVRHVPVPGSDKSEHTQRWI